jgi:hypothetical protein
MSCRPTSTNLEVLSPSVRRVRMRKIKSNTFVDYFDPLTPTLIGRGRKDSACPGRTETLERYPKNANMFGETLL